MILMAVDIYKSNFVNEKWTNPVNLGPNINTESWESQPAISSDGRQLFLSLIVQVKRRKRHMGFLRMLMEYGWKLRT